MSRYIKYQGKLVKFADKLLKMAEHIYNEGVYYLRTIAEGGTVQNRGLVEDLYKLWEEQGRLDNIKVAILPQAGSVQRTSGIYRFFSKLFTLRTDANDVTQTTANSQPYFVNGAMVNPNGASRFMTHPTVSFGAGEAWSVSFMAMYNGGNGSSFFTTVELFGTDLDTNNRLLFKSGAVDYSFGFTNSLGDFVSFSVNSRRRIGKLIYGNLIADGVGNLSLYLNGEFNSVKAITTSFVLTTVMSGRPSSFFPGYLSMYSIQSGALTPTQILEEYNLLRSYIPEIATTLIGTDEIATENCQMVATPMGREINLNNTAGNVDKLLNTSFATTANWTAQADWTIAGDGQAVKVAGTSARYIYQDVVLTSGRYYKIRINTSAISGQIVITNQIGSPDTIFGGYFSVSSGDVTLYRLATGNATQIRLYGRDVTTMNLLDFEIQEVGFAGASDLYNGLISQGSTVSNALAAAAMWRSPDSDNDKQAVFGKIYNGYAAQLLKMDIDAYNAANPSTPWGYHVATLQDFQAIKDTLGGVEIAGKKIKIDGNEYWTSDNGDNTSGVQALGSGYIDENGEYQDYKEATGFWTVTENGDMLEVVTLRDELNELFITE